MIIKVKKIVDTDWNLCKRFGYKYYNFLQDKWRTNVNECFRSRLENNEARLILRGKLNGQTGQTESQELESWTAVSILLGLVSTV